MCIGCYEDYGRPKIINDYTRFAAAAINAVRTENPVGGELHIVIDDWNLEDSSLAFCAKHVKTAAERACHDVLKALDLDERASAMAIAEGWI